MAKEPDRNDGLLDHLEARLSWKRVDLSLGIIESHVPEPVKKR
jgi:hypothetical protein